jgi:hypothetical protein
MSQYIESAGTIIIASLQGPATINSQNNQLMLRHKSHEPCRAIWMDATQRWTC